ncbi:MAG: hypothetical protein H6702_11690 [Myxococcales bacterium]|nr:hypothetical protein [Myxococcales bacterium]
MNLGSSYPPAGFIFALAYWHCASAPTYDAVSVGRQGEGQMRRTASIKIFGTVALVVVLVGCGDDLQAALNAAQSAAQTAKAAQAGAEAAASQASKAADEARQGAVRAANAAQAGAQAAASQARRAADQATQAAGAAVAEAQRASRDAAAAAGRAEQAAEAKLPQQPAQAPVESSPPPVVAADYLWAYLPGWLTWLGWLLVAWLVWFVGVELLRHLASPWLRGRPAVFGEATQRPPIEPPSHPDELLPLYREHVSSDRTPPPKNRLTIHFSGHQQRLIVLGEFILSRRQLDITASRSKWKGLLFSRLRRGLWWVREVRLAQGADQGDLVLSVGDPTTDLVRVTLQPGQELGVRIDCLVAYDDHLCVLGHRPGGVLVRLASWLAGYGWRQPIIENPGDPSDPSARPGQVVLAGQDLRRRLIHPARGQAPDIASAVLAAWTPGLGLSLRGNVGYPQALWAWCLTVFERLPIPLLGAITGLIARFLAILVPPPVEWLSLSVGSGVGVVIIEQSLRSSPSSEASPGRAGRRQRGPAVQVNLVQVG